MTSAKMFFTRGQNADVLRQNAPVMFEANPDLTELRAALTQLAWTGAIHSCLFEIRQFRENMKKKAATEGLAQEEDEVLEIVTTALIILDYEPDHGLARFNLGSIREEHARDEAWPEDAGEPTVADLARFALFRAHNHMVELFRQQHRLERMKLVLDEEKKVSKSRNATVARVEEEEDNNNNKTKGDEKEDEQQAPRTGAGHSTTSSSATHRIFPSRPQPDIGFYLRTLEILRNKKDFADDDDIVLGIMWRFV